MSAVLDLVGRSTVTDDGILLIERVFSAPVWVQISASLFALAWMVWTLWPDFSQANEMKKLRKEFKATNERAWSFMPEFRDAVDKMNSQAAEFDAARSELSAARMSMEEAVARLEAKLFEHMEGVGKVWQTAEAYADHAAERAAGREALLVREELLKVIERLNSRMEAIERVVSRTGMPANPQNEPPNE